MGNHNQSKISNRYADVKIGFNLIDDGLVGQQLFAGEATRLAYGTEEAQEGRDAFLEKRSRIIPKFPWHFKICSHISSHDVDTHFEKRYFFRLT